MLVSGVGELGATVVHMLQAQLTDPSAGVEVVVPRVSAGLAAMFDQWFPVEKFEIQPMTGEAPVRPEIGALIAGFPTRGTKEEGDPQIFSCISQLNFAPLMHNYGFAISGVAQYALYLLNKLYRPDISFDRAVALAHYVVTETATQDGKVGGPVRMAAISSGEGYFELSPELLKKLKSEDQRVNEAMAGLFSDSRG
jgi:hypothetical protein